MDSIPLDIPIADKNYGFVIDNRKCIGCHACSVACKAENEVPLSVNRTWVKYVETGAYPDTTRHFQVTRCNHCANPPCVRICPTAAMYQRADGIVEFDSSACIGCKACMQACPYDAIYIDPDTHTAAKCHYCAHRTDIGLEPACVVVCPEHAIISGDMNDPTAEISQLLATQKVTVRKPEQGTAPKLFYINGNDVAMHPTATERVPSSYLWADSLPIHESKEQGATNKEALPTGQSLVNQKSSIVMHSNGTPIYSPQQQGQPMNGPIQMGQGRMAEHMVQVAYNAQHLIPWHWPVPAYLVTKGIGSGIFMLLSLGLGLGWFSFHAESVVLAGFISLLFIAITTGLLVFDLERPERFLYILMRPQWKSWLTRGAVLLIGFTVVAGLWWLLEFGALNGWWGEMSNGLRAVFLWVGLPLAIGVATYTAFLFAQAEGRDLWQSPLLPFHLVVQAVLSGAAALAIVNAFSPLPDAMMQVVTWALIASLIVDLFVTLTGEFGIPHASEIAAKAAHEISHGHYKNYFWYGYIGMGHVAAFVLVLLGAAWAAALAGLFILVGLYLYEYAFVLAPQEIPNS